MRLCYENFTISDNLDGSHLNRCYNADRDIFGRVETDCEDAKYIELSKISVLNTACITMIVFWDVSVVS
jgi:hypothetical protein